MRWQDPRPAPAHAAQNQAVLRISGREPTIDESDDSGIGGDRRPLVGQDLDEFNCAALIAAVPRPQLRKIASLVWKRA